MDKATKLKLKTIISYDDWRILIDPENGNYYVVDDECDYKPVIQVHEEQWSCENEPEDDDIFNKDFDYDYCGEYDDLIETAGPYLVRYGWFIVKE